MCADEVENLSIRSTRGTHKSPFLLPYYVCGQGLKSHRILLSGHLRLPSPATAPARPGTPPGTIEKESCENTMKTPAKAPGKNEQHVKPNQLSLMQRTTAIVLAAALLGSALLGVL